MYEEPRRFTEQQEYLDNFADLGKKIVIKNKGMFANEMPHAVNITVKIESSDDLVQVVEQEYYLKKYLFNKLDVVHSNDDVFSAVCRLVEVYLSIGHLESKEADQVRAFVISNLTLI